MNLPRPLPRLGVFVPQAVSSASHVSCNQNGILVWGFWEWSPLPKIGQNNCHLYWMCIRGNRLMCVFQSIVPQKGQNDSLGGTIFFEPNYRDKCTRYDFLTRQEKHTQLQWNSWTWSPWLWLRNMHAFHANDVHCRSSMHGKAVHYRVCNCIC